MILEPLHSTGDGETHRSLGSSNPPSTHVLGNLDIGCKAALLQLISSKIREANSAAGTAQRLGFASVSITLRSVLRHDQVIPRDTQFIC